MYVGVLWQDTVEYLIIPIIFRHRHLPKPIYKAAKLRRTVYDAERKREDRKRAHSAPGAVPHPPARKKRIVAEIE